MSEQPKTPTTDELIAAVKFAYHCTSRCPSRGVSNGCNTHHASASGVLALYARLCSQNSPIKDMSADWLRGFDNGFEFCDGDERLNDLIDGLRAGRAVADAVFNWPDRKNKTPLDVPPDDWNETEKNMFYMRRDWRRVMDSLSDLHSRIDEITGETLARFRERTKPLTPTTEASDE